ncbi:hypothetical protein RHMOL_Rhmol07G0060500 [Rhododendron molle]|uniref:Uncharacterized protein n=1 Tax=Rhododendron molle TaxID=49168 RepID=A0ACC0MXF1_RHOML|nr:hypothetical protein RHMOL_Rhmol07G0060500 [Rhododendron molle]
MCFFPSPEKLVGTDEATTCIGLAIRNRTSGMYGDSYIVAKNFLKISVGHMDSPNIVDIGLTQMLTLVVDRNSTAELDHASNGTRPESKEKMEGYSFPLCVKIVEALQRSRERFHLNTFHVLWHNTRWDSQGNACPVFHGFLLLLFQVETSTGSLVPTAFDRTSRCPDEIVRRVRLTACSENHRWNGKLIETYDTQTDRFIIAPFSWTRRLLYFASTVRQLSDSEILSSCSTSPFSEVPDFVDNERRLCDYLIRHPDWRETFPMNQPRIFERTADGTWRRQGVKLSPD